MLENLETCIVLRRPLIGIALAVVFGMMVASAELFSLETLLFSAFFCMGLTGLLFRSRASGIGVFSSVALVAACRFMLAVSPLSGAEINRIQPQLPLENVQMVGRIAGAPAYHAYRSGDFGVWVFPFDCEGMKTLDEWATYRGRIQVRVSGSRLSDTFRRGERIRFSGLLHLRDFPGSPPLELTVSAPSGWDLLAGPSRFSPILWGQRLRERAAQSLSNGIEPHSAQLAVLKALLLGYRKAVPPEIIQQFKRTGTLHIFAISGLHVGIAGLLITVALKTMGIPRDRWGLWLLPLLLAYVMTTGMKSSALRALTMAAVYFLAPLFCRKPDVPTSIAFAVLLLLFFQPLNMLSAGFIFSFTVVGFLVMAFAVVPRKILFRGSGWRRALWGYVASLGVTTGAAFIASVPLTALFFGSFTTLSLVANLIVVPLTFCIVLSGWLSILLPVAADIFNHAALVFINGLLGTVGTLSRLPGTHGTVSPPPLTALLFWYSGWIYFFVQARTAPQRSTAFILIGLSIALTFLAMG